MIVPPLDELDDYASAQDMIDASWEMSLRMTGFGAASDRNWHVENGKIIDSETGEEID